MTCTQNDIHVHKMTCSQNDPFTKLHVDMLTC